jgi:DNA end-binding protein Ku
MAARRTKTAKRTSPEPRSPRQASPRKTVERAGARRPIWTGQLRLALVSVPVEVFPATKTGARIAFHQVHKPSGKRIHYEKVVPGLGPVDSEEIYKGYEIAKGQYVLLEDRELDAVKLEARKTLDLVQFVAETEIAPVWFDKPYYVVPDGELAEEAYRVIRDALRESTKVGIGQFVMRGREYIAALRPCGDGLLLETLRFADEVREAAPFFRSIRDEKSDRELMDLAGSLIEKKTAPFEADRFRDQYTDALRALIEAKAKHGRPLEIEEETPEPSGKVINLMDALKRSVRGAGAADDRHTDRRARRKAG